MRSIWLYNIRTQKQMSQEEVALLSGIDRSYYTKIESGYTPSVKVAKNIANVLGFKWTIFFEDKCAINAQKQSV